MDALDTLASRLDGEMGLRIVLAGAADALEPAGVIRQANPAALDLVGKTSVRELVCLIRGASLVVSNDLDDGPGSLRAAVAMANATTGTSEVITFDTTFFASAKTILLTTGEIAITDGVTIQGPGAAMVSVSGNNAGRVFNVSDAVAGAIEVVIGGLTLTGGVDSGPGGAMVIADEAVTLNAVTFTVNRSTSAGTCTGRPRRARCRRGCTPSAP